MVGPQLILPGSYSSESWHDGDVVEGSLSFFQKRPLASIIKEVCDG